ncbi:MAG: DUF3298 domain-containing protein [Oscillibacter sp.]|nr:DUF3298 domain-containing protein [Oscillibacter sp.]
MKNFDRAREAYENTPIPQELDQRVRAGIQQGRKNRRQRTVRRWLSAAACFAVLVAALNVSPTIAKAAAEVPVLGGLFRVMTFISYDASDGGINYVVSVPRLESDADLAGQVNAAIRQRVDAHTARARQDWADYKEAFFATGGTEEEWGDREMDVFVGYEVMSQTDTQVSFVVTLAEGWVSSMEERYYYNLDLAEDRVLTLQDVLGKDWVEICNASIQEQIAASVDEEGFSYFFAPEDGGFTTVDGDTGFYIREDGTVVVAFPRYSIAAGAAGTPEFPIG